MRNGTGFVGWGVHQRFTATGPDAARQIQDWFAEVSAGLRIEDSVGVRGSGPVAFVSLGFDDDDAIGGRRPENGARPGRRTISLIRIGPIGAADSRPDGTERTRSARCR